MDRMGQKYVGELNRDKCEKKGGAIAQGIDVESNDKCGREKLIIQGIGQRGMEQGWNKKCRRKKEQER